MDQHQCLFRMCVAGASTALFGAAGVGGQVQTIPAWSGNQEVGGGFGAAIAGVSDLDADGRHDLVVGAPAETSQGVTQGGRVYVYSGRIGLRLFSLESPRNEGFGIFGWAVGGVPDTDADDAGDIVVGAPYENPGLLPIDTGRAYLFSGATGTLRFILGSADPQASGRFGFSVAGMGDIHGDGHGEVLVGAPFETAGSSPAGAGRVYQFNGATGGRIRTFSAPVEQAHARFGWAVAALPDVNGDGREDIAISSPFFDLDQKATDAGRVYVFNGRTGILLRVLTSPARETGGRFGHSLTGVPDTNGDSRGDVVVGAPFEDPGLSPEDNGRAYIYSGATGILLRKLFPPTPTVQGRFGIGVGGTADLNNDGRGDVVIGAQGESVGLLQGAGRIHVFSGATGIRIKTIVSPNAESGAAFGAAVVGVPDANLNNRGDVAGGAPDEDPGASPSGTGRAYLFKF